MSAAPGTGTLHPPADFAVRAAGMTVAQIEEHFCVSNRVATRWRDQAGLSPTRRSPSGAWVKRTWTAEEDAYIRTAFAEGQGYAEIAKALGLSHSQVTSRGYNLRLVRPDPADAMPRVDRWVCGPCGTKSDASLDFGCAKCWPLRRVVA